MNDGDLCPVCGKGTVKRKVLTEIFNYKGNKLSYPNYIVYKCNICKESVVDKKSMKESGKAIKDFFKQVNGKENSLDKPTDYCMMF